MSGLIDDDLLYRDDGDLEAGEHQRHGRGGQMEKSVSQDESYEDVDGMQQKAGELDRYARMQLMQDNILEAFAMFEKNFQYHIKLFGLDSIEFRTYFDMTMNYVNDYCLSLIREGRIDLAYRILKRAEGFCVVGRYSTSVKYRVIVLNHLGCCMRRFGKNKLALGYLASAFKISKSTNSPDLLAISCLNLCAVYRQLEDHKKALDYARKAASEYSHLIINSNQEDFESRQAYEEDYKDKVRQLAICYHNLSVEEDHFSNPEKSLEYSKKAYQLMKSKFGENNNITSKFKANYYNKLNNEPNDTQSVFTMRPLSEKGKPRRSSSKASLGKKLPEWKIKSNPYGGTQKSKYHKGCNPHPEYSQHMTQPAPRHNNWLQESPMRSPKQPVIVKANRGTIDRLSSSKAARRPPVAEGKQQSASQTQVGRLEFTSTLRELEELGVTSSDDSEEEREAKMKANRAKFGQAVGVEESRKEKVGKALDERKDIEAKDRDADRKRKREEEKQRALEEEMRKEKEQRDEISREKSQFASGKNIANYLTAKDLVDKQLQNNLNDFHFVLKTAAKQGFPTTVHVLVMLDRATKRTLQFNLRNQTKPKDLQQLVWYTDELKHLKSSSKAEIEFLGSKVAKKLLKENLQCVKGAYSWREKQTLAIVNPPVEVTAQAKVQEQPAVQNKKVVQADTKPEPEPVEKGFYDDDDLDELPKTVSKPIEADKKSPAIMEKPADIVQADAGDKVDKEEKGFFDDEEEINDAKVERAAGNSKGRLKAEGGQPEDETGKQDAEIIAGEKAVEKEDKLNESVLSNKSASSVVSRRSAIFESDAYTISAYKKFDEKKVTLKLFKKGEKTPIDEFDIDKPEAEDEDQLAQLARTDLKECKLEKTEYGAVILTFSEEQESPATTEPQMFSPKHIAENVGVYASYVKERPPPLYKEKIKDDYWWYLSESHEYGCYKVSLVVVDKEKETEEYKDWNFPAIPIQENMTDEQFKEILARFDINWEIHKIVELSTHQVSGAEYDQEEGLEEAPEEIEAGLEGAEMNDGEEEDDEFGMANAGPKYEIVVERSREEDNVVEVISVHLKSKEEIDRKKLKCVLNEDARPGENDKKLEYIKNSWEASPKTGKLVQKPPPKEEENYDDDEGS